MRSLTKQAAFNKVWDHFIVNKGRQSTDREGACCYRLNKKATGKIRCGVGVLIPDKEYRSEFDDFGGIPAQRLMKDVSTLKSLPSQFLSSLQKEHDSLMPTKFRVM